MKNKGFTLIELIISVNILIGVVFLLVLLPMWTDRNLDFWMTHFKGEEVNIPFWISWITAILTNGLAVVANIVAEIARFMI